MRKEIKQISLQTIIDLEFYLEENYIRLMLLHETTDGLHPFVDHDVLARPNVVRHELDLLLQTSHRKINSSRSSAGLSYN